jgi:DHA1 family multidrug/chloramphenicol efflux transport protein-like MFS transporter
MFRPILQISPRRALLFSLLLGLFELLTYICSDVVMPGMLRVTRELGADARYVPMTLNAYLLGGVALQWLLGPLSDRFGRRPLLLAGSLVFALSCLATYWVGGIDAFLALRFMQGLAVGFVVVVSYPALQETFAETDAVRVIALLGNIALLSPLLGPLVGGLLLSVLGWRTLFVLIAALAALVWLGLWRFMPETIGVDREGAERLEPQSLKPADIAASYRDLLRNGRFMAGSAALGLVGLPLIAWIALAPVLLMHNLGVSTLAYGLWQLPVFGGLIAGNLLLNRFAERFELAVLARRSLLPLFGGLGLALLATLASGQPWALVLGLTVYALGLGVCNATLYRLTLFSSESGKGAVSAMLGMISVGIFGLGGSALASFGAGTSLAHFAGAAAITAALSAGPLYRLLAPDDVPLPVPQDA